MSSLSVFVSARPYVCLSTSLQSADPCLEHRHSRATDSMMSKALCLPTKPCLRLPQKLKKTSRLYHGAKQNASKPPPLRHKVTTARRRRRETLQSTAPAQQNGVRRYKSYDLRKHTHTHTQNNILQIIQTHILDLRQQYVIVISQTVVDGCGWLQTPEQHVANTTCTPKPLRHAFRKRSNHDSTTVLGCRDAQDRSRASPTLVLFNCEMVAACLRPHVYRLCVCQSPAPVLGPSWKHLFILPGQCEARHRNSTCVSGFQNLLRGQHLRDEFSAFGHSGVPSRPSPAPAAPDPWRLVSARPLGHSVRWAAGRLRLRQHATSQWHHAPRRRSPPKRVTSLSIPHVTCLKRSQPSM